MFTLLGSVLLTLILVGLGTLTFARLGAESETERQLRHDATVVIEGIEDLLEPNGQDGATEERPNLRIPLAIENILQVDNLDVFLLDGQGRLIEGQQDTGLALSESQILALQASQTVSGRQDDLVFAASGRPRGRQTIVVFLARPVDDLLGNAVGWFLLASLIAVSFTGVVGWLLSKKLAAPVIASSEVAALISNGDLTARHANPRAGAVELQQLATSLNTMAEGLQRSQLHDQQFLLSISHDLRTPLTSIRGYAEALADNMGDPQRAGSVILSEADRLERLIKDLLQLSRLESRQFLIHAVPVDLTSAAAESVAGFEREAEQLGIELSFTGAQGANLVSADPDRLAQVLGNLLENACKYANSTIEVDVYHQSISVSDDGPGISAQDLPHVFERLYVSRNRPVRKEVGSGLGLAIVAQLMEAMNGSVSAQSAPNSGTKFVLEFEKSS